MAYVRGHAEDYNRWISHGRLSMMVIKKTFSDGGEREQKDGLMRRASHISARLRHTSWAGTITGEKQTFQLATIYENKVCWPR